ncbi:hypothetical protein GCM10009799_47370 [Nocardiopsis rhodophaea]|uniref:Acyl-CoA carboxylase subunit epsilon n=1 Tax=Nocardiopsis rhodophaea TaxID=280238 RepID=A0ABP5F3H4_9ACTN
MTTEASLVVARGNPDEAELAVLTVVLTAALRRGAAGAPPPPAPAPWKDPRRSRCQSAGSWRRRGT